MGDKGKRRVKRREVKARLLRDLQGHRVEPLQEAEQPDHRWSLDFVSDSLADGRRFRILNVIDDFTRECVLQVIDTSIPGRRVVRELEMLDRKPLVNVSDNGTEFRSKAM